MGLPLRLLLLSLAFGAGAAPAADRLHSAACTGALAALQAEETTAIAQARSRAAGEGPGPEQAARLAGAQRAAAQACLGGPAEATRPAQPPTAAAPRLPPPRPRAVLPAAAGAAPPPLAIPPLRTLTSCDAGGCWASDGTRLTRAGSMLVGPAGVCAVVGAVLSCHEPGRRAGACVRPRTDRVRRGRYGADSGPESSGSGASPTLQEKRWTSAMARRPNWAFPTTTAPAPGPN